MIIKDIYYNITSVHYSVHYKTRNMKRIRIDFLSFSCVNMIIIEKSYWKYIGNSNNKTCISWYYKIKSLII